MVILLSVDRCNLEIEHTFYDTAEDAKEAMIHSILALTSCETVDELTKELDEDEGEYLSDTGACIQTSHWGTVCYEIVPIESKE